MVEDVHILEYDDGMGEEGAVNVNLLFAHILMEYYAQYIFN